MFTGTLKPFQEDAVQRMLERESMLLAAIMGSGKAQPVSEPVLTPEGFVPMGSLQVGDEVVGSDGKPTEVVGVFPQGRRGVYRVTFSDGSSTRCDSEHLWAVHTAQDRYNDRPLRVMTTNDIRANGTLDKHGNSRFFIPMAGVVDHPERDLMVDPYLLGLLLGDGCLLHNRVTLSTADPELTGWVLALAPEGDVETRREGDYDYHIVYRGQRNNPLLDRLRQLGVYGHKAHEKFVPEVYLRSSASQRLALLQGLLDTDGSVDGARTGTCIEFSSASLQLAEAVADLVRSFGGSPYLRRKTTSHRDSHRVTFTVWEGLEFFRLNRKQSAVTTPTKYGPRRSIVSIEEDGVEEVQCIKVAAEDSLYVTKDHIVTHNTVMTIAAIERLIESGEVESGLVVVPAAVKFQWLEAFEEFTDVARVLVIDGTPSQRAEQYARAPRYEYVIVNYMQLLNDWDEIASLPMDFLVCDEVQAIKSFKAQRSKRVKQLLPRYRFGLTGTAIDNKAEELFSIMEWVDDSVLGHWRRFDKTFISRNRYGWVEKYVNLPLLHNTMQEAMVRYSYEDIKEYLPGREQQAVLVAQRRKMRTLYNQISTDLQVELAAAAGAGMSFSLEDHYSSDSSASPAELAQRGRIMSRMQCLLMLCDHPQLLVESARRFNSPTENTGSKYAAEIHGRGWLDDLPPATKFDDVLDYIEKVMEDDPVNKVVLFSFFLPTLDWLHEELGKRGIRSITHTGKMSNRVKQDVRNEFKTDPDCRVFLSSEAGGVGVDLPVANYLINYDLPWSAGRLKQRNFRIQRLSSTFPTIHIRDFITEGSLEERQYAVLRKKQALDGAIMDGDFDDTGELVMDDIGTLKDFLAQAG